MREPLFFRLYTVTEPRRDERCETAYRGSRQCRGSCNNRHIHAQT